MANTAILPSIANNGITQVGETSSANIVKISYPNLSALAGGGSFMENPMVIGANNSYISNAQMVANANIPAPNVGSTSHDGEMFASPFVSSNLNIYFPLGNPVRTIYPNLPTGNKFPNSF